jgi:non-lysosomal glucosylceramidase
MPYITLWPDTERSKLAAWAHNQATSGPDAGMLAEEIKQSNPDAPRGRRMGDGSSAFILEILELYKWANDTTTLRLYYPTVKRAASWQMNVSASFGVPTKLQSTYDILGFPSYDIAAYTSVFHIAALAATVEMATVMNDTAFRTQCAAALARAQVAFETPQWNQTKQAYDAASTGCLGSATGSGTCTDGIGVFADSFYAQVLAYSAGMGQITNRTGRVKAHLATQLRRGCVHYAAGSNAPRPGCPNGMVVLTGREEDGGGTTGGCDLQVWEMSHPNHATLGVHMGLDVKEMLAVFERLI